ncbi:RNA ligase [Mycobacterium phage Zulu]|nr:RNA ligase [Mycobacterium phage Zulu]WGH21471.1 RNA ligase [Mycobacterium phage Tucker]
MTIEFQPWPKTPRLNGASMVITEKIDGTNAAVVISDDYEVGAQSRNRLITPENDNYGFAKWVWENADKLREILGPGHHYGEWWGSGIQRGYGLTNGEKRFSLFNTGRWADELWKSENEGIKVQGLDIVPVLYEGHLDTEDIRKTVRHLEVCGSYASPGFDKPEGVIVYIPRSNSMFKVLIENDDIPKGLV